MINSKITKIGISFCVEARLEKQGTKSPNIYSARKQTIISFVIGMKLCEEPIKTNPTIQITVARPQSMDFLDVPDNALSEMEAKCKQ